MTPPIDSSEGRRLAERGITDRDQVVDDIERVRLAWGSMTRAAKELNSGESTLYGVRAATAPINSNLLLALYGPSGHKLVANHPAGKPWADAKPAAKATPRIVSASPPPPIEAPPAPAAVAPPREPVALVEVIREAATATADVPPIATQPAVPARFAGALDTLREARTDALERRVAAQAAHTEAEEEITALDAALRVLERRAA